MDLSTNCVLYGDIMLPQEAFYTSDSFEMKLVACIFETAKSITELKLTETELALYQSLVLLWPGNNASWRRSAPLVEQPFFYPCLFYFICRTKWCAR